MTRTPSHDEQLARQSAALLRSLSDDLDLLSDVSSDLDNLSTPVNELTYNGPLSQSDRDEAREILDKHTDFRDSLTNPQAFETASTKIAERLALLTSELLSAIQASGS